MRTAKADGRSAGPRSEAPHGQPGAHQDKDDAYQDADFDHAPMPS